MIERKQLLDVFLISNTVPNLDKMHNRKYVAHQGETMKRLLPLFLSIFAQVSFAFEYPVVGVCDIVITQTDDVLKIIDHTFVLPQAYTSMVECQSLEPARCANEWNRVYAEMAVSRRILLDNGTLSSWIRWDCLTWDQKRVPTTVKEFERSPRPSTYVPPDSGLNFKDLPSLERMMDVMRELWEFTVEHFDELPWGTILAIGAILLGLGLLKGGEFIATGPGALEPASVAAAICAIVMLLWSNFPDAEREKYRDFYQAGIFQEIENGRWTLSIPGKSEDRQTTISVEERKGSWIFRSSDRCAKGTAKNIRDLTPEDC